MAIQNFLSGGYYGKLGATVGQRWKNKRTIRTYVVPNNPRTPSQQANRGKFADAVTYSQIGMQMNYYCALFDDPNMTRWNYRMKVARELKAAGFNDLDLIPLYPMSYTPTILLSDFTRSKVEGNTHITFSCQNLTSEVDRVFSIMFALYTEENQFLGYKLYLGYYYANNPGFIEVDVDDINEINNNCFVRIVSNDDENLSAPLIASPQLQVTGKVIDVHTFDNTIKDVEVTNEGITITFAELWKATPTTNAASVDVKCVVNGSLVTINGTDLMLFNNNGYCALEVEYQTTEPQSLPAFPIGSSIDNLNVDYKGENWDITIQNASTPYSNSDTNRTFNNTISSIERNGTTFIITLTTALPAISTHNLSLSIVAVKNGDFVEEDVNISNIFGRQISFKQSGASEANIYAFPAGSSITLSGSIVGNGVTYTASKQTAQAISNTDLNRTFNNSISSIARSGTVFTINFADTLPTVTENDLYLLVKAVKNGAFVSDYVTIATMSAKAISFNQSGATGANIYAFPNGSAITLSGSVVGNGVTYAAETQTEQAISNTDLTRSILSSPAWNSTSTKEIKFTIAFGGIVSATSKTFNIVTSGRLGIRTPEAQLFNIVGDGSVLTFTCAGSRALYPMNTNGDKISITSTDLVVNGVTYNIANQDVNLRNAITTSKYFDELDWTFQRDGDGTTNNPLQFLAMSAYVYGATETNKEWSNLPVITRIEDYDNVIICEPTGATAYIENDGESVLIYYQDYYADAADNNALDLNFNVVNENIPTLQINGITYSFTQSELNKIWSGKIKDWLV